MSAALLGQRTERVAQAIAAVWGYRSSNAYLRMSDAKKELFRDAAKAAIEAAELTETAA